MTRNDIYLGIGLAMILVPAIVLIVFGGPFTSAQWIGLAIFVVVGFGFFVAATPNHKEDDDASSV